MQYAITSLNNQNIQWAFSLRHELFPDELDYINTIHNYAVKQERLLGLCLTKKLVAEHFDIPFASTHILHNSFGCPSIAVNEYRISISHTTGWVACAINNSSIGIDIENMDTFKKEMPLCVFSKKEWDYICDASNSKESIYRQCQIWTFKEAYFKAFGSGIPNYRSVSLFDYRHLCFQRVINNCCMTIFKTM